MSFGKGIFDTYNMDTSHPESVVTDLIFIKKAKDMTMLG
tara:strand:- start:78 stop:194 length:117 start_codon:yes stop_codon:yes gene_type:complete